MASIRQEMVDHKLPDEHQYEDMRLPGVISKENLDKVKTFHLQDDILIASYPKTGTSWVQEMVWIIAHDGDIEAAKKQEVQERVPFIDMTDYLTGKSYMDNMATNPHPAILKTHLPARFFEMQLKEDKAKYIIQIRNPKDTLISLYHFFKAEIILGNFSGTWDEFFAMAVKHGCHYGSQFDMYESWWKYHERPDMLWVKYEDMHKDLPNELRRIAAFLGKELSDEKIMALAKHGSFTSMKNNDMVNYSGPGYSDGSPFMRAGKMAQWQKTFSKEQSDVIDALYEKHYKANGLILDFE